MKTRHKNYIFTNKSHSPCSVMSTVLGVIAAVGLWLSLYLSYRNGGARFDGYGAAASLALLFTVAGIILAVIGLLQQDRFRLFSNVGIGINAVNLLLIGVILNTAAYRWWHR